MVYLLGAMFVIGGLCLLWVSYSASGRHVRDVLASGNELLGLIPYKWSKPIGYVLGVLISLLGILILIFH
jgi:hypothetical protein